jgi:hypothetical protein
LLFNVLAMVAEFESDLIRLRTREGMKVAKAKGRLRGKQPKLKPNQTKHLLELHDSGSYTQAELAELFGVGRSTIYRTIERMRPKPPRTGAAIRTSRPSPRVNHHPPVAASWPLMLSAARRAPALPLHDMSAAERLLEAAMKLAAHIAMTLCEAGEETNSARRTNSCGRYLCNRLGMTEDRQSGSHRIDAPTCAVRFCSPAGCRTHHPRRKPGL